MTERVLVTGARAPVALDLARSLRAAGLEPVLADSVPARAARMSKAVSTVARYASPVHQPAQFAADVGALLDRFDPVLVIPTCEEVFHLAGLAEAAGFSDRMLAPLMDALTTLHSKSRFAALCRRLSLPVPETHECSEPADLERFADVSADWVFKPVWSRFGARTLVAPSRHDLATIRPSIARPWVAQRRIDGDEVSFYAVCRDGDLTAFSAYRSDWRLSGGASYAFQPVEPAVNGRLRDMAQRLAGFAVTGQIACDAIVDGAGRPWLIECNPRATSGVHLFGRSAGFGRALLGRGVADPDETPRHIASALWLHGLPCALRAGRLAAWSGQRRTGRDVVTAPADRAPALGALLDVLGFGLRALTRGVSLTEATTTDIEWNGPPLAEPGSPPGL